MSESEKTPPLSPEDAEQLDLLTKFRNERWHSSNCLRCGTGNWWVGGQQSTNLVIATNAGIVPNVMHAAGLMYFYWFACRNCGNAELIMKDVFDEWKKERASRG